MIQRHIFLVAAVLSITLWGCGSSKDEMTKPAPQGSAEQLFTEAKASYARQDWPEAIRIFEEVRIQAPASPMAAEATYLEAMSRYNQESYAGSAVDFRAVRRNYPSSPFAARAQYMVGESYYQVSSRPELDQSYTLLALNEFQNFLHDFPNAPTTLTDSAQKRIVEIRGMLAEKYLLAAKLYDKLDYPKSAAIYYQRVLDNFYDTPPATESEIRLAEIDFDLKKLDEARKALDAFDTKYLQSATPSERQRALTLHSKLPNP
ncbi:MAG: outer membrane protein assembly factor BamD [Candidatus Kapaibacterium sp.]